MRQHGVIGWRTSAGDRLRTAVPVAAHAARPRRVVSISNSGATCVLSADATEDFGSHGAFDAATLAGTHASPAVYVTARAAIDRGLL